MQFHSDERVPRGAAASAAIGTRHAPPSSAAHAATPAFPIEIITLPFMCPRVTNFGYGAAAISTISRICLPMKLFIAGAFHLLDVIQSYLLIAGSGSGAAFYMPIWDRGSSKIMCTAMAPIPAVPGALLRTEGCADGHSMVGPMIMGARRHSLLNRIIPVLSVPEQGLGVNHIFRVSCQTLRSRPTAISA